MATNYYLYFVTALFPLIIGFGYYHQAVFGKAWMKSSKLSDEEIKSGNMGLILGLTYVLGLIISVMLPSLIIHQSHLVSLYFPEMQDQSSAEFAELSGLLEKFDTKYRSYTHGMVHAGFLSLLIVTPIIAINALFERKSWKYILIHSGYWFITLVLMGAVLCQFLHFEF